MAMPNGYAKWLCQMAMPNDYAKWLSQMAKPNDYTKLETDDDGDDEILG